MYVVLYVRCTGAAVIGAGTFEAVVVVFEAGAAVVAAAVEVVVETAVVVDVVATGCAVCAREVLAAGCAC